MATDAHNAKVDRLLRMIREGKTMTLRQQLSLVVQLSIPAIVAQFSSIAMQYIDAAMVGSVGADASASIGLVSTSTWLKSGLPCRWHIWSARMISGGHGRCCANLL